MAEDPIPEAIETMTASLRSSMVEAQDGLMLSCINLLDQFAVQVASGPMVQRHYGPGIKASASVLRLVLDGIKAGR